MFEVLNVNRSYYVNFTTNFVSLSISSPPWLSWRYRHRCVNSICMPYIRLLSYPRWHLIKSLTILFHSWPKQVYSASTYISWEGCQYNWQQLTEHDFQVESHGVQPSITFNDSVKNSYYSFKLRSQSTRINRTISQWSSAVTPNVELKMQQQFPFEIRQVLSFNFVVWMCTLLSLTMHPSIFVPLGLSSTRHLNKCYMCKAEPCHLIFVIFLKMIIMPTF